MIKLTKSDIINCNKSIESGRIQIGTITLQMNVMRLMPFRRVSNIWVSLIDSYL